MKVRTVVKIDEDLCNGCGECVPSCAEGAIQIIDGKARLVGDNLCDGLGACLGHCPMGAITLEERSADAFDEHAVEVHLARMERIGGGCPGMRELTLEPQREAAETAAPDAQAGLRNWPVQLHLINPRADYFRGADLLIAADCVAFAYPKFHADLQRGRVVAIGCPKLDDGHAYIDKLADILRTGGVQSLTVARMEVPCCGGLAQIVRLAQQRAGTDVPVAVQVVSSDGKLL